MIRPRALGSAAVGIMLGIAVTLLIAGLAIWMVRGSGIRIDTSRPAVVRHIQQLQRLETVVYGMDKIVSGGVESRYFPKMLAGDRILLIVYGEVTAGVDLAKLDSENINVNDRGVTVTLPPAEIFATRIDNEKTRVYSRETGLFSVADPNLESEVRKAAEQQIRQAALDGKILQTAATNARATVTTFLQGLGFAHVDVR